LKFHETSVKGAYVVEMERRGDDRGFFARAFCEDEFREAGLVSRFVQANVSLNAEKATLRGMHYQLPPVSEVKLVRCTRGALYDVILDLRPQSETFGQWFGVELTEENRLTLYVPRGFAHGFVTLADNTEAFYLMSDPYTPGGERGIRYNDPKFAIQWPIAPKVMSDKDKVWPLFDAGYHQPELMRTLS
jgi:dTDP-4-dehydrorhamnose 3,5-epimerase